MKLRSGKTYNTDPHIRFETRIQTILDDFATISQRIKIVKTGINLCSANSSTRQVYQQRIRDHNGAQEILRQNMRALYRDYAKSQAFGARDTDQYGELRAIKHRVSKLESEILMCPIDSEETRTGLEKDLHDHKALLISYGSLGEQLPCTTHTDMTTAIAFVRQKILESNIAVGVEAKNTVAIELMSFLLSVSDELFTNRWFIPKEIIIKKALEFESCPTTCATLRDICVHLRVRIERIAS